LPRPAASTLNLNSAAGVLARRHDGVTDELKLDYGKFVLKGDLSKIEFVDPKPCP